MESFKYGNGVWATKEGSSLAYNDENDNYKPLPFSVTRDSIATRVNKEGLIEVVGKDKLRIDYTDSSKGVALLEPSRTNLVTYSEDFSDSSWIKSGSGGGSTPIVTSNYAISPDGTQNADKIDLDLNSSTGSLDWSWVYINKTSTGSDETFSIYLKAASDNDIGKVIRVGYITYSDVILTSDWKRVELTQSASAATYSYGFRLRGSENTSDTASFYAWGAQFEAGSYATSYIPTSGSATQRQADVANGAGNSEVFNDSEGVLFADIAALANDGTSRIISISDPSATNRIHLFYFVEANYIYANYRAGGTTRSTAQYEINNVLNPTKVAYKYKSGDFSLWINGFEVDTDTNTTMIADGALTKLSFEQGNGGNNFYGKAKRIGYFDAVLTDAELEALTSYTSFTNMANELNLTIK